MLNSILEWFSSSDLNSGSTSGGGQSESMADNAAKSSEDELSKKLGHLKVSKEVKRLNILLLGETGVGKSTFINALANYLTFSDFSRAEKEKLLVLIPSSMTVQDKNDDSCTIQIGDQHVNEHVNTGESATQDVKTYVFPILHRNLEVCLIDTPGMGDTRGIHLDHTNCEHILGYISNLHQIHAICFLFKPNQARSTVLFQYCMGQILSRLEKSASQNIVFAFTNTRGADYGTGETMPILQKAVDAIYKNPPHVKIPLNKNVFCFDNEPFRYLAGLQNNIEFSDSQKRRYRESWRKSLEQCNSMIEYIDQLTPHYVKHTNAINEVRRAILQLSQPLADVTQLINTNINILKRHEDNLNMDNQSVEELKKKLYMPSVEMTTEKMSMPMTICTFKDCAEIYKVGGSNIFHPKKKCHNPCYLNNVPVEIIGSPELYNCACIDRSNGNCIHCKCSFKLHMHVYYLTRQKEVQKRDDNVLKAINNKEQAKARLQDLIKQMQRKQVELEEEYQIIVSCSARFAHFIQSNAITPINDYYAEYINYLIEREKLLGPACSMQNIRSLQRLMEQYKKEKEVFERALKSGECKDLLTPETIQKFIRDLYQLKHNGSKIKELFDCQKSARKNEHGKYTEYVHPQIPLGSTQKDEKKKDKDNKKSNKKGGNDGNKKPNNKPDFKGPKQKNVGGNFHRNSPPPSYQDSVRPHHNQHRPSPLMQNYVPPPNQPPNPPNYPPHSPYYPQNVPYQHSGPSTHHPGYPPYYPPHYTPSSQPHSGTSFNVTDPTKRSGEPVINVTITQAKDTPNVPPAPDYYRHDPYYQHYPHHPPPPGAPYHPSYPYGHYPPPPPPTGAPVPPPPVYHEQYPTSSQSYQRHGVNRNAQNQQQNQQRNARGKAFRGGRGKTGGISRRRNNKNKNQDKNKQNNGSCSDSEDSGSSKN